jgi:signal transduction histidine kinase
VLVDRSQLVRVFRNLVANAIKFQAQGTPEVRISATRDGAFQCFSVTDNGIGIQPAARERLFQLFHRLNRDGQFAGTGIGLASCRRIVEQHGGRIWVESEEGKGSTFRFTLPAE